MGKKFGWPGAKSRWGGFIPERPGVAIETENVLKTRESGVGGNSAPDTQACV
jgi:hypothetical protein